MFASLVLKTTIVVSGAFVPVSHLIPSAWSRQFTPSCFFLGSTFPAKPLLNSSLSLNISGKDYPRVMLDFVRSRAGRMEAIRHTSVVRFGTYEMGLHSGELRKAGVRIRVQQQPLRLLEILLERPGEVVTREELRSRIWPDESFGDFDQAVNVAVAKLRSALGDSADNPRFVETIPRRGYRFIAEVRVVNLPDNKTELSSQPPSVAADKVAPEISGEVAPPRNLPARRAWTALGLAILLLFSVLVGWMFLRKTAPPANATPSTAVRSLAVLPLENLSNDSQDYFADGMTDELITDLAQIGALRVISRTSIMPYKGVRKPLSQICVTDQSVQGVKPFINRRS